MPPTKVNNVLYIATLQIARYKDKLNYIQAIIEKTNCDFDARIVCDYYIDEIPLPNTSPEEIKEIERINRAEVISQQNIPKCLICGSTNIKKISGISKAGNIALFGIFPYVI